MPIDITGWIHYSHLLPRSIFVLFVDLYTAGLMGLEAMLEAFLLSSHVLNLNISTKEVNKGEAESIPPSAWESLPWYHRGVLIFLLWACSLPGGLEHLDRGLPPGHPTSCRPSQEVHLHPVRLAGLLSAR